MLQQKLTEYIAAAFSGLWIQSHEHDEAVREIYELCKSKGWGLATWDAAMGIQQEKSGENAPTDPVAAVKKIQAMSFKLKKDDEYTPFVMVMMNLHRFLTNITLCQQVAHQLLRGKQQKQFLIVLSPVVQIPVELEKQFVVIEHDLPNFDQVDKIIKSTATPQEIPQEAAEYKALLDSAAGLTRYELEGAVSLSIIRHRKVTSDVMWEMKAQALKKSGLLTLHYGSATFADLGGLSHIKDFCTSALKPGKKNHPLAIPKGMLCLGLPGCGKSEMCKALGTEVNRPVLKVEMAKMMGSLYGQTENNIYQMTRLAEAMAPCVLFIDEINHAFSGSKSGGELDSGVTNRWFGYLLSWISDHTSDVFVVGACNDVSSLPPAFRRSERFDATFFFDLPSKEEREAIWNIYLKKFDMQGQSQLIHKIKDEHWTGADIKACCRMSRLLDKDIYEASKEVSPVSLPGDEAVVSLRKWAEENNCLSASYKGKYSQRGEQEALADIVDVVYRTTGKPSRKITRPD